MVTTWPPANGRVTAGADRAVERTLREEVREAVTRLLGERQLFTPEREDEARIRALIKEHVAGYQRRAATTNNAPVLLNSVAGVAIVLFGGFAVMEGVLSIGMLVAFKTLASMFNAPVAGTYFIAIKFNSQNVIGQPRPNPLTVHYDFTTTGVPRSSTSRA